MSFKDLPGGENNQAKSLGGTKDNSTKKESNATKQR